MTNQEAANKLRSHMMTCGFLMPIGWIQTNGEGSEFEEAMRMALDALEQSDEKPERLEDQHETRTKNIRLENDNEPKTH